VCDFPGCTKDYSSKSNLTTHKRTQHSDSRDLRFMCDFPGCTKDYSAKKNLDAHKNSEHSDSRPVYVCNVPGCGDRFRHGNSARAHEGKHTTCKRCGIVIPSIKKKEVLTHIEMCLRTLVSAEGA
jgi:uncharacterized Zn-finger protein